MIKSPAGLFVMCEELHARNPAAFDGLVKNLVLIDFAVHHTMLTESSLGRECSDTYQFLFGEPGSPRSRERFEIRSFSACYDRYVSVDVGRHACGDEVIPHAYG